MSRSLSSLQFGLQGTLDIPVAATWKWDGKGKLKFDDEIVVEEYLTGEPGGAVEDVHIRGTGSTLTLDDTPISFQSLVYMLNSSIKAFAGATTAFDFAYPTSTTLNAIAMNTWEVSLAGQMTALDYEIPNAFLPTWAIHGDADANGGQIFFNGVVKGGKAVASTKTNSLTFLAGREMMNLRAASVDFNAVGTAFGAGTIATPTVGTVKAFSLEQQRMFLPGYYADARANKDFGVIEGGSDYILKGKITALLNDTMIAQVAAARAGTPITFQMVVPGAATVKADFRLPLVWTSTPEILSEEKEGLVMVSFDYQSRYMRTTTAAGPAINITLASTTIT